LVPVALLRYAGFPFRVITDLADPAAHQHVDQHVGANRLATPRREAAKMRTGITTRAGGSHWACPMCYPLRSGREDSSRQARNAA
jgi:hypothetical protein